MRKGIYYGEKIVEVSESTNEVKIVVSEMFGNLFIKSGEQDVNVYFNNKLLGELGSGYFKELPVGVHRVELKGDGLYWEGEVEIKAGEGAKVEAYPRAFGQITYSLSEGTTAEINGRIYSKKIRGSGKLDLIRTGSYTITVSGEIYEPYTHTELVGRANYLIERIRIKKDEHDKKERLESLLVQKK